MNPQLRVANDPFENQLAARMALAKKQGWDDNEIQQSAQMERMAYQQQMANKRATAPNPVAQPTKKKKNFFVDQISTAGGIIGGIAGAPLGIIGAGAGGAIGSGLGQTLENLISGDKWSDNVAKETALGGVFGAGPLKLAKGVAGGGRALLSGADDVVGAASRAANKSLLAGAGKKVAQAGDDLAIKAFRLNPGQLTKFRTKFGEDAAQVIKKYKFNNADDIAQKGIQPLQQQFDEIVKTIPGVDKKSLEAAFKSKYEKLLTSPIQRNKEIGKALKSQADDVLKGFGDTVDANELNVLRRQFDDLVNYTEKAANPATYGVNKRAADAIRSTLQETAQTQGMPLKDVGREISKLKQLYEAANKQSDLGRGNLPMGLLNQLGGVMGMAGGGVPGAFIGAAGTQLVNSPVGRKAIMKGTDKVASNLITAGTRGAGTSAKNVALRIGGQGAARGVIGQATQSSGIPLDQAIMNQSSENAFSMPMNTTTANMPNNVQNMGSQYTQNNQMSSLFAPENIETNIQKILSANGTMKDVQEYLAVFKSVSALQPQQTTQKPLNTTAAGVVADTRTGLGALSDLSSSISQSSANNPIFGRIRSANPFDTNAQSLQAQVATAKQIVGKALEGGVLRKEDEVKYAKLLPTMSDTDEVAQFKIDQLTRLINGRLNEYLTGIGQGGGGNTLEDALMQYAQ